MTSAWSERNIPSMAPLPGTRGWRFLSTANELLCLCFERCACARFELRRRARTPPNCRSPADRNPVLMSQSAPQGRVGDREVGFVESNAGASQSAQAISREEDHQALRVIGGQLCGCSMSAEANTSTGAPFSIFCRIRPEEPNSGVSTSSDCIGKRCRRSVIGCTKTARRHHLQRIRRAGDEKVSIRTIGQEAVTLPANILQSKFHSKSDHII